jgi:uncharacterized protein (DUF697 family)
MNKKKLPKAIRPEATHEAEPAAATATHKAASHKPAASHSRRAQAKKLVKRFSMWSGAAGLIPLPFVDVAAVGGVQLQMLRRISAVYEIPFSENLGKAFIASTVGSMVPASSVVGAASIVKGMPVVGTAVGAVAMPALSAGATYAIGMAFVQHFDTGGTLLDFTPPDYREFIKVQKGS